MFSFIVQENPSSGILQEYSQLAGDSCFYQEEFLRASVFAGSKIVAFSVQNNGVPALFAVGFEVNGILSSILTFPTFPRLIDPDPDVAALFWSGLKSYCKQRRIYKLRLNSFEAIPMDVPEIGIPVLHQKRFEYLLDLTLEPDRFFKNFSSNHRRNIRKAEKQNLICGHVTHSEDQKSTQLWVKKLCFFGLFLIFSIFPQNLMVLKLYLVSASTF